MNIIMPSLTDKNNDTSSSSFGKKNIAKIVKNLAVDKISHPCPSGTSDKENGSGRKCVPNNSK